MAQKVFTTRFNYSIPSDELKKTMAAVAPAFSAIPGCYWKIWLLNEDSSEAGGIYLFESHAALTQFQNSDLFARVTGNPAFSNLQTGTFGIEEAASVITRAPLSTI